MDFCYGVGCDPGLLPGMGSIVRGAIHPRTAHNERLLVRCPLSPTFSPITL